MKKYRLFALILAIALLPGAVHAQDETQVSLAGGYTITFPDGWEQAESGGIYTLSQDNLVITVTLPDVLASELDLNVTMDAADVLGEIYVTRLDQTLDKEADLQTQLAGERVFMAAHEFETDDGAGRGMSVVLEVTPGQFALMEFQAPADVYETALPDALQIMESLKVSEAVTDGSAEPCEVRAARTYVDVRVGPGQNRGVFSSMKADTWFGVLGKKTIDDGSLWWRLDIADTGGANELWVADADVETDGGCDQVIDVNAPPLIFGPPPALPAETNAGQSATGQTGSSDTDNDTPVTNPSKIPATGMWNFVFASEVLVSCQGGPTIHYPSAEFGFISSTYQVSASPDGSMVLVGTRPYYGRDGYYTSEETTLDGWYLSWHLYVSSPTQMSADAAVAEIGVPCSGTIRISVQYVG